MDTNDREAYLANQIESLSYFIGEGIDTFVKNTLKMYPEEVQIEVLKELSEHYTFPDPVAQ